MYRIRKSDQRGHANHGWLDTYHTFSFAGYYDPEHVHFRHLRVINEDRIGAGQGFGTHPHDNMEIITYVVSGAIAHKDSMGNGSVIRPGEIQAMSAGTGITHSEYNPSDTQQTHLLQIWLMPENQGLKPDYQQKSYVDFADKNTLVLIASNNPDANAIVVNSNVDLYRAEMDSGHAVEHVLAAGRFGWIQLIKGAVDVNGHALTSGDGLAVSAVGNLTISASADAEFLLFDMG
ncbi:pirin family protein [Marinicella sp. W31]|uniref:pirin family protein n=1 Tax=Marinicella sp. W31 TaxID=3023713 RepID=UPI00375797AF